MMTSLRVKLLEDRISEREVFGSDIAKTMEELRLLVMAKINGLGGHLKSPFDRKIQEISVVYAATFGHGATRRP